jgi:hypothetical protein
MFNHRLILPKGETVVEAKPILQVMQTHEIVPKLISGVNTDIISSGLYLLVELKDPQWQTIPTEYVDNEEYDKARGYSMPEVLMAKDAEV